MNTMIEFLREGDEFYQHLDIVDHRKVEVKATEGVTIERRMTIWDMIKFW